MREEIRRQRLTPRQTRNYGHIRDGTQFAKGSVLTEKAMTLNLTPRLTIRIRKATDAAGHVVRTQTRRLSITSLSFLKLEVMLFKYHAK